MIDALTEAVKNGISLWVTSTTHNLFLCISQMVDSVGLIFLMVTWLLNMMDVPSTRNWFYTVCAFYIIIKIILKAISLI